ncbi:MAG: FtsX-like permease family protein [Planctomycetota bacterium]|nr:MAG: FtsX-like permease family protein [Planctomycetota bacterium]
MAVVPLEYNLRSLFVRRSSTLLTVIGIGATVAVLAGVLALQQGFERLFSETGRDDVAVFLRPGASSEGESGFTREHAETLIKGAPEIARDAQGQPLASGELYVAVRMRKHDGGETNVPVRGVQDFSFAIRGDQLRIVEGKRFTPGTDEVIVGTSLAQRIPSSKVGDVVVLNLTPFRVVGHFESDGPFASEMWGDLDRMTEALQRDGCSRVIAQLAAGADADVKALSERLESDKVSPAKVQTERQYLTTQTIALSGILVGLGGFLGFVMGIAAVFTGINSMLSAISARTHEIGVLLSIGFRPWSIFVAFLLESMLLGLLGGAVGCLMALPLNGVRTGTTNFQTFTEVAFAFRITSDVLVPAVLFALLLGVLGGLWPAWRASRMRPTEALRRV